MHLPFGFLYCTTAKPLPALSGTLQSPTTNSSKAYPSSSSKLLQRFPLISHLPTPPPPPKISQTARVPSHCFFWKPVCSTALGGATFRLPTPLSLYGLTTGTVALLTQSLPVSKSPCYCSNTVDKLQFKKTRASKQTQISSIFLVKEKLIQCAFL